MPRNNFSKLRTSVYLSKSRLFATKIWENVFQTIPNISFFDIERKTKSETFWSKNIFSHILVRFSRSYEFLDVTARFSMKNDPRGPEFQLSTTLGGGVKSQLKILDSTFGQK